MVNNNGKNGGIVRGKYEPEASYKRRVWFVRKYDERGGKGGKEEALRLAGIWVSMILLRCRYPEKLEKIIHGALKDMGGNGVKNGFGKK